MKEILITTTVMILCVLLIRQLFRGKISSRLQYALWLLVALRLVIPVSAQFDLGPLSDFRLMDLVEKDESGIAERLNETIRLEDPIQMTMDSRSILFRLMAADEVREAAGEMSNDGPTSVFLAGTLGFTRLDILWFLWGLGAFAVGMWFLTTNVVFSRRLRKTRRLFDLPEKARTAVFGEDAPAEEGTKRRIFSLFRKKGRLPALYLAEGISSPCLYGFPGREAVYLTAEVAEDSDKLRHVVMHELIHKKHGDSFWALLRGVLVTVYWFHPLVWVAAVCSKRDCELACDEGALAVLGEEERISYGETLLSIITRKGRVSDLVCTATTMTGSKKNVKERIRFIAKRPKTLLAAIAGVVLLMAAVCLFVFTKDARFHGTIVDRQTGLTVMGADMQIPLPASIGGISGCVVEKQSGDVVIYHAAAQEEVGRFASMSLADALKLADHGRELLPVGDYGHNYLLRAYLGEPLSRIEHTYTPATQGVIGHEDTYYIPSEEENPMLSEDWEVIPLEEEERFEEIIVTGPADPDKMEIMHSYTPNPSAAGEAGTDNAAAAGVPGTDSNMTAGVSGTDSDDTTYIIEDENKADYLPNEQITTTSYRPHEVNADEQGRSGCYVYVRANDSGKVKDVYQEEMAFIDGELRQIVDRVIILSLNQGRREALVDALAENRTLYVGDNTKVGALIDALPLPPTLNRAEGFSMQTTEQPYSLQFGYEMSTDHYTKEDQDMLYFNAAMLFYAIGNVEKIDMEVKSPAGSGTVMTYDRVEMEKDLPVLQSVDYEDDRIFRDHLSELQTAAEKHLSTALRAYLSTGSTE